MPGQRDDGRIASRSRIDEDLPRVAGKWIVKDNAVVIFLGKSRKSLRAVCGLAHHHIVLDGLEGPDSCEAIDGVVINDEKSHGTSYGCLHRTMLSNYSRLKLWRRLRHNLRRIEMTFAGGTSAHGAIYFTRSAPHRMPSLQRSAAYAGTCARRPNVQ